MTAHAAGFAAVSAGLHARMRNLATAAPIPFRRQNGGAYRIPSLELRPGLGEAGSCGFRLHVDDGRPRPGGR